MAKTYLDADMDAELDGIEDSDEEMEQDKEKADGVDEDKGGGDDEGDSDDDDLMDDDEEFDQQTLEKIAGLEQELQTNPYNYSAYTDLIDILRKGSDFDKLRKIRQTFRTNYPLSPQLWIDWTQDELKIAASDEDKKMISDLFEQGIKDYVSVDLWLEYFKFSLGNIGTQEGIDTARQVFERGITACGLHAGKGSLLWDSYREFEIAMLAMAGSANPEAQKKQKGRVCNLLKRQLRVPLLDMDNTLQEYQEFTGEEPDANVKREFSKAKEKLKKIETFEINVMDKENRGLDSYREYLKFELKEKDPTRIQLLYERAITDHCLEASLWEEYLTYLDTNLRIDTVSFPVYERAVRNCPWNGNIWSDYIMSLERFEKDHSEILKVFEDCLSVGFSDPTAYLQVWLAFVTYTRRRTEFDKEETQSMTELRKVLDRACDHLTKVGGDPDCEMLKFYANIEADQFRNLENARKIWTDILQVHQFKASVWMQAIEFEKIFGDKKHLRKRLERAMEKTHDDPEAIAKLWLQFEREEGSLEAFDHCRKMIRLKMEKVEAQRDKESREQHDTDERNKNKIEKKKEKDKQYRRDKRHQAQELKRESQIESKQEAASNSDFKVPSLPSSTAVAPPPGFQSKKAVEPPPGFKDAGKKVEPPPGFPGNSSQGKKRVEPPPGFPGEQSPGQQQVKKLKLDPNLSEEELRKLSTVFLSNLDFEVDEDTIMNIMGSSGQIKEVRLVKHPNGKSKGYAFVEFSTPDEAEAAKARDNELVKGRPMYISECDPERKKGPIFKYSTGLDKKKLFVKGLDPSVTKADLNTLFSSYGELSDIRLVTYRNGHSKGIAYVEFKDEVDAAKALVKADGLKLKDKEIEVALSNPPKRKDEAGAGAGAGAGGGDVKSLGGTQQKDFGPRGKGRSQLAFMPRSLSTASVVPAKAGSKLDLVKFVKPGGASKKSDTDETKSKEEKNGQGDKEASSENQANGKPAKSNNDFRNMLLGSK